ncbi:hypothetical protein VC83_03304 [Pseudogymnoascus destructans]|uniref:Uncharacterized protein n=1 Tax=Pseudogymnoascus destructans TaxID=655981 RepID=A0A177AEX9_9PEZI|nr:uncharacterized protein VC83_03304 [Pseudogymnoascus destructans]OAF60637.1 hypothetical protein VC83_03304 [Pseudogymnoascus destructans]
MPRSGSGPSNRNGLVFRDLSSEIMFVNKMDHFFSSMHSMGLYYTKESEGSVYYNGTESVTIGNAVPLGNASFTNGSAPNPGHDSRIFSYHPYVSMYQYQDAGSYGPGDHLQPGADGGRDEREPRIPAHLLG